MSQNTRRTTVIRAELLESRNLMTGGAGSLFAVIPATIPSAGATIEVPFTIANSEFTAPKHSFKLGLDISAQSGTPTIMSVDSGGSGPRVLHVASHAKYDPTVSAKLNGKTLTSAALVPVTVNAKPGSYGVRVTASSQETGNINVGFYLPGDANGDGTVDKSDVNTIRTDMGAKFGDAKYSIDADTNRDGVINRQDIKVAQGNLGAHTIVNPLVTLAPDTTAIDSHTQTTTQGTMPYTGTATPGATVTMTDTQNPQVTPISTVADTSGKISFVAHLTPGWNIYQVKVKDTFGQQISGTQLPLKYVAPAT